MLGSMNPCELLRISAVDTVQSYAARLAGYTVFWG